MEELKELQEKLAWYQKKNEELEQRVDEITDFIENAAMPLHWVDGQGIIIWANQAELDALGYTKQEYIGFPISNFHEDQEVINDILHRLINNETLYNYPAKLKCKNGTIKHVLISSNVLRKDGEFVHTRCFTKDITPIIKEKERKAELMAELERSQRKLTRSKNLFKSIALNIPNSIISVIDKDHRLMTIEGDLMKKLGYNHVDYAGKHLSEIISPEQYDLIKHHHERVLNGEKFSIERKASTGEDFIVYFIPLKNDQDEVEAGLIIETDITNVKEAEEKSAKLAAIIESTDDAIISKSLEGIITSWNHSAQRTFGYTAEEMIGESILKLIPLDRHDEETHILSRLRKGERVEHFETKRLRKDGNLLDVSLTISPLKDLQGNIIGLSKIARDITERKQEEQRKNDFVAMVSHELKTPLTSITSYVQLVLGKAKKEGNEFGINALSRAEVQAKKMNTMIHDFLSLAKLEDSRIQMNMSNFELSILIREIVGDTQLLSVNHTLQLINCDHFDIYADRDKIGQVLTNLLSNAVKYSPKGGIVIIGCEKQEGKVKVYVTDQGIGISKNDQKRLFERFYRVKNEQAKSISGFGIGLYLVTEILNYHDSKIEVQSDEGQGATFYFSLDLVS